MADRIRNLVVVVSGTNWDRARLGVHHVAEGLSAYAPVLFVDAPQFPPKARRNMEGGHPPGEPRLRQLSDSLFRLTPLAPPGKTRAGLSAVTSMMLRRTLVRSVRALGAEVHAVVAYSSHSMVFGVCGERRRVYYSSDDFRAGAILTGRSIRRVTRIEDRLAAEADTIVTVSPHLVDMWEERGHSALLIPNGVHDTAFFDVDTAPLPPDVSLPRPIAGFVGHVSDRIDLGLLEAVADQGVSVLLVGPRQTTFTADRRLGELLSRPNVLWVGPRRFEDLPSYLRLTDVGLVPYADTAFNRASFPLKTLEYLAAGRAVVATPLPSVRWLNTDLITIGQGPDEFAEAVATHAAAGPSPALVEARRLFARGHRWSQRVLSLATALGLAPESAVKDG